MMAGSEHTDNALHSQLSTDPHSPLERWQRRRLLGRGKKSVTLFELLIKKHGMRRLVFLNHAYIF